MGRWMRIGSGRLTGLIDHRFTQVLVFYEAVVLVTTQIIDPDCCLAAATDEATPSLGQDQCSPDHAGKRRRGKTWSQARKAAAKCAIQIEERVALNWPEALVILQSSCRDASIQIAPSRPQTADSFSSMSSLRVCIMRENTLPFSVADAVEKTRIRYRHQLYSVAKFVLSQLNIHASASTPDFCAQAQAMIVNQHLFARQVHAIPPVEKKPGLPGCDLVLHQSIGFFVIDDAEDRQQQVLVAVGG